MCKLQLPAPHNLSSSLSTPSIKGERAAFAVIERGVTVIGRGGAAPPLIAVWLTASGVHPACELFGIQLDAGGVPPACKQIAVIRRVHNTLLCLPAMGNYSIFFSFFFFFFFFFFIVVDVAALAIGLRGEGRER